LFNNTRKVNKNIRVHFLVLTLAVIDFTTLLAP
jgi:hypothetical protein